MTRTLLDTSIVTAATVPPIDGDLAISAITLTELHHGVIAAHTPTNRAERLRRLRLLESAFAPLPIDAAVAASYGQLAAAALENGTAPSRVTDLLIAATAHAHGARLYTLTPDAYRGLDHLLDIISPATAALDTSESR